MSDPHRLEGRVAVVTGASRNIGYAVAQALSRAGASVVINGVDGEGLEAARKRLQEDAPSPVVAVGGDICDSAVTARIVAETIEIFGGVDILVNNALIDGGIDGFAVLDAPRESWDRKLEGYVHAPLRLLREMYPSMRERGHGAVINVVSGVAFTPITPMGTYGVTKAAMVALTRQLARELAPEIRVNALCPGTTSEDGVLAHQAMRPLLDKVPMKRMGRAAEAALGAVYLASDASSYTTGHVLFVDGGRTELVTPD